MVLITELFRNDNDGKYITMSNPLEVIIEASSIEQLNALIKSAEDAIELKKAGEIQAIREQMVQMLSLIHIEMCIRDSSKRAAHRFQKAAPRVRPFSWRTHVPK